MSEMILCIKTPIYAYSLHIRKDGRGQNIRLVGIEYWLTFCLHLRLWDTGPLFLMGRLVDGHPMQREEMLVKHPKKTLGLK